MIDLLLSIPPVPGCLLFMTLTAVVGLTAYLVTFQLLAKRQPDDAMKEIREATGNLFRVVGWLVSLLLSLAFTEVTREVVVIEAAIEGEAAAILDTHHNLRRLGIENARDVQRLLIDYTAAVIEDDWPALSHDELSDRAGARLRQFEDAVLRLDPTGPSHELLLPHLIDDIDKISDYRLARLQQARERPPFTLITVIFGYLVTMVFFGVYRPRRAIVILVALYTVFVGIVFYLILAMSAPFQGASPIDPEPLQYALTLMQA